MKLAIYEVGFIPQNVKSQVQEVQAFSQWQYLGKNLLSTVFIALLDYCIANSKSNMMEQLANPKSSYKNEQNIKISQYVYGLLMGKINPKEFFTQLKGIDSQNEKGRQLLEEFCQLQGLNKTQNNIQLTLDSIANFFSITINLIRQCQTGKGGKSRVFIFPLADGFYLIKQSSPMIQFINPPQQACSMCQKRYDDYFITPCLHISCSKCLNDKINKANQQMTILCNNKCMQKILVKDIQKYLIKEVNTQVKKQQPEQSFNLSQSQQFTNDNQKSNPSHNIIQNSYQKTNQVYYNNLMDPTSQQKCNYCQQININQLFNNNPCSHKFCIDCFKKKIISKEQKCPIKDCSKLISASLFQQRVQLENDTNKNQKPVLLQNQQFVRCNKCKNEYSLNSLYKDKRCMHFVCFACIQLQVQKQIQNKTNYYSITCPSCNNTYGQEFEKYYDQQQLRLVEERIKYDEQFLKEDQERELKEREQQQALQQQKQKQQQQQQLQQSASYQQVEKYSYGLNDAQKLQQQQQVQKDRQNSSSQIKDLVEIEQINQFQEGFTQYEQGECTRCFTRFSEFNLRQEIDCQQHKIGVCCRINCDRCPQCEQKNVNSLSIRIKPKLILQTFIQQVEVFSQSNIYNSSIKQYNYGNADDYFRLNSRANVCQSQIKPQQRNSTMDTNLFRSQALQSNVVSVYGAGFKR